MESQPAGLFLRQILHKVFLEDWVMKLVALAITLALWLGVTGLSTPTTQRLTDVLLNFSYSNNIEITNSPRQSIDLVVTGDKRKLAQINKNDLIVSMDISDLMPGDRVLRLTPDTVSYSLPSGVRLDAIQPNAIPIRIEAVEEKEVDVKPDTYGNIPDGYEIYSETVTPLKVRVRGPAGFIRALDFVPTERIDLTDRTSDFTARQVPVAISNPKASVLTQTVVDVVIRIGERRVERVYSVQVDDGSGRRAVVTLFGGRSVFENVRPADLRVEMVRNEAGVEVARAVLPPSLQGRVEVRDVDLRGQ